MQSQNDAKGRRVTIDLTPAATKEVDRLKIVTGLTTADVFRHAISLFRVYVNAKQRGLNVFTRPQSSNNPETLIEMPVSIQEIDHESGSLNNRK
jgi:hypothetical protein